MALPDGSLLDLVKLGYQDAAGALAEHESGHAAVALFVGYDIEYATIDEAARDGGGLVRLAPNDRKPALANLLIVLAGNLAHGDPIQWKPADLGDNGDESTAAALVAKLELDRNAWFEAVDLTRAMLEVPQVVRARKAIAGALYEHGMLSGAQVRRLFDGHAL